MNLQKAINILKRFNKYRRGADVKVDSPYVVGVAIDTILEYFEKQKYENK